MSDISYDTDFYAWTQVQAQALRAKQWEALDLEHLAEEIEDLGKSDRRTIQSHLRILLLHLLKVAYQRQRRLSWLRSIRYAREAIELTLNDSPSLRRELPDFLAWVYPRAHKAAEEETRLPVATFPEACPWLLERVLDADFFPDA
jgi:signal transduction histidine kinase